MKDIELLKLQKKAADLLGVTRQSLGLPDCWDLKEKKKPEKTKHTVGKHPNLDIKCPETICVGETSRSPAENIMLPTAQGR